MSDSNQEASLLGKRVRNDNAEPQGNREPETRPSGSIEEDDESGDDIGPMPVSAHEAVIKKKRKGARSANPSHRRTLKNTECHCSPCT